MDLSRFIRILFAVFVTAGLTFAPLVAPATAMQAVGMADDSAMSADMPCCPEKQKQGDCQDCPLIAICMAKVLPDGPFGTGLPIRETASRTLLPPDEPVLAGLTRPPPDQPPRFLV